MAENRRGKDRRFYFSLGQLVILGVGFTVASVIIFFLGMIVGRGIEERKIVKEEEPLVKIPVKPSSAGSAPGSQPKEELTFYDTLTKSPKSRSSDAEREKEPRRAEKAETKVPVKEATEKTSEKTAEKSAPPNESAKESQAAKGPEADTGWTVQVNAFPDERSARIWVDRLKNKGYNAYMVEAEIKGRIWYRVRVGNYATREEAEKAEDTLQKKENFSKAFATSR